jgi:hypothetical protein
MVVKGVVDIANLISAKDEFRLGLKVMVNISF